MKFFFSRFHQGYAVMLSDVMTVQHVEMNAAGQSRIFRVQWQGYGDVPFSLIRCRADSWSEEKTLQTCQDGSEFEPQVGKQILRMWALPAQLEIQGTIPALNTKLGNLLYLSYLCSVSYFILSTVRPLHSGSHLLKQSLQIGSILKSKRERKMKRKEARGCKENILRSAASCSPFEA
uniref:YTH domain-containing protein n=1 Tax=Eptatretus burgeri TaxID=7764 RepID=A0A8C4Q3U3_EPTBU